MTEIWCAIVGYLFGIAASWVIFRPTRAWKDGWDAALKELGHEEQNDENE